jgi:DNA-binding MarR family transcriptional regulator
MKKKNSAKAAAQDGRWSGAAGPDGWTFMTNHTHVLLCLYRDPEQRLRDVATAVGVTERMVQRVVAELHAAGYLKISKDGRRNRYEVHSELRLRHPLESHHTIGELLELLSSEAARSQ